MITKKRIGLILGPLSFLLIQLFIEPEGLSSEGNSVLAITSWIAIWWISEAIPIEATSLLPIILFPLFLAPPPGRRPPTWPPPLHLAAAARGAVPLAHDRLLLHHLRPRLLHLLPCLPHPPVRARVGPPVGPHPGGKMLKHKIRKSRKKRQTKWMMISR